MEAQELAVAYTAHDSIEADMIVSNLRAEGIPCGARIGRIRGDSAIRPGSQLFGDGTGPPGYAEILVHPGNLDRARRLIQALLEGEIEEFPEGEEEL